MEHDHELADTTDKRLLITILINFLIPAAQICGGIYSGSMALISDAVHNFSDFTALIITYIAHLIGKKSPTHRHTFGLRRIEIIAAVVNASLLGGIAVIIAVEAVKRLSNPSPVGAGLVAVLALVGIAGNGFSAWLLHKDSKHNLNIRGAFFHMMGDLLTSVAVLAGAIILHFTPWLWIDSILSLMIVVYILVNCFSLLKESVHVLMDGTPIGLDLMDIKKTLEELPGVAGIHYLHTWLIGGDLVALTCHVVVSDQLVSATNQLSGIIRDTLLKRFGINHPVLQFESNECGDGALLCQLACNTNKGS
ncbi:MAG: cation diffusion facilitator family transporter [Pseudomonadota bacterium]